VGEKWPKHCMQIWIKIKKEKMERSKPSNCRC
jgi:hypothetical protein